MDSITLLEKLLKLERELSVLEEKFEERNKWCTILEYWLIKKFDYDVEYNRHLFEQAKENERRRRQEDSYMEEEQAQQHQSDIEVEYESSTSLPPYSQILGRTRKNHYAHDRNLLTRSHDDDMEVEAKQSVDSGQESHSQTTHSVNEDATEVNGLVETLLDDDDLHHFSPERQSDQELLLTVPNANEQIDHHSTHTQFQSKLGEKLFFIEQNADSLLNKSSPTLLTTDSIKIEPQTGPKLRCKRCKKVFDGLSESEIDNHMQTVHLSSIKKKKAELGVSVRCQYCHKSLSSTYVHRHESKCNRNPKASTTCTGDTQMRKGPSLVFSLPQENSDDLKTDSYIRPVVRREGPSIPGIVNSSYDDINGASSSCGESLPNPGPATNGCSKSCDSSDKGGVVNILRFSCKVCQLSYSSLRTCRQHIVAEHLKEVLKTPLITQSVANNSRVELKEGGNETTTNMNKGVPTLMELLNGTKFKTPTVQPTTMTQQRKSHLQTDTPISLLASLSPGLRPGNPGSSAFQPVKNSTTSSSSTKNIFPYQCLHCQSQNVSNSFEYLQDLHMHVLRYHVKTTTVNYKCPLCSLEFSQEAFADHIVSAHRQGTLLPNHFNENSAAMPHIENSESLCEEAYENSGNSNNSSSTNCGQEQFEDNFSNPTLVAEEESVNHTGAVVQCGECGTFMSFDDAKVHVIEVHGHQHHQNIATNARDK